MPKSSFQQHHHLLAYRLETCSLTCSFSMCREPFFFCEGIPSYNPVTWTISDLTPSAKSDIAEQEARGLLDFPWLSLTLGVFMIADLMGSLTALWNKAGSGMGSGDGAGRGWIRHSTTCQILTLFLGLICLSGSTVTCASCRSGTSIKYQPRLHGLRAEQGMFPLPKEASQGWNSPMGFSGALPAGGLWWIELPNRELFWLPSQLS